MKDLNKYIGESLFDVDDNIDNVSVSVENRKWFKKLTNSSGIMLSDFLDDIYKAIKKDKGRVCQSLSQMDYDENYIRFDVVESKNPMRNKSIKLIISFLLGNRHSWKGYTIKHYSLNEHINGVVNYTRCGYMMHKTDFKYDTKNYTITSKTFTMPKNWEGIVELIENDGELI